MTAVKGVKAMADLMTAISMAIEAASKAGMSNSQINAVLEMVHDTIEAADDE